MYTSIPFDSVNAVRFADAGLDEIRFHLLDGRLERYLEVIDECHRVGINVGIELPCEPDKSDSLFKLLDEINGSNVQFLNLNELEITVGNQENMDVRGFNLSGAMTAAAEGSAALVAIRSGEDAIAVLGVGSHDTQRYRTEDGTLFLEYLAEVIGQLPASG